MLKLVRLLVLFDCLDKTKMKVLLLALDCVTFRTLHKISETIDDSLIDNEKTILAVVATFLCLSSLLFVTVSDSLGKTQCVTGDVWASW